MFSLISLMKKIDLSFAVETFRFTPSSYNGMLKKKIKIPNITESQYHVVRTITVAILM